MPAYSYTAFDAEGKKLSGNVSAISERDARRLIKDLNLIPLDVSDHFPSKAAFFELKKNHWCLRQDKWQLYWDRR